MIGAVRIADHLSADEVRARMQMSGGMLCVQKWLVIYNALVDPRPISEIALHTGLSEGTVLRVIAEYNTRGPESLERRTCVGDSPEGFAERVRSMFP